MGGKGTLSTSFLGNSRGNPRRQGFQPGEVRLRSLASAVRFYERIGYERLEVWFFVGMDPIDIKGIDQI